MSKLSLYLIFFILLLSFGLITLRYWVRRDYLQYGKLSPFIAFLQGLLFFVYGGFPYLYLEGDWPAVSVPLIMHIPGVLLIFCGLVFLVYGMFRLGVLRSIGSGTPTLEQSGIYTLSRNPQAIACGLYVIGFFMLWPSWYAVGWVLLYFVLIHIMILTEEEHLIRLHGAKYQDYYERVPRYLGKNSFLREVNR